MDDTTRPTHVVITGGEVTYTPLTDAEIAEQQEHEREVTEQRREQAAARAADLALIRSKMEQSEAYAALVRILNINVSEE
jgi:hypothetical protein